MQMTKFKSKTIEIATIIKTWLYNYINLKLLLKYFFGEGKVSI